jgi:hypothetical protein
MYEKEVTVQKPNKIVGGRRTKKVRTVSSAEFHVMYYLSSHSRE